MGVACRLYLRIQAPSVRTKLYPEALVQKISIDGLDGKKEIVDYTGN